MKNKYLLIIFTLLMFNSVCLKAQSKLGHTEDYVASLEPRAQPNFIFPEIEKFDGTYQFIIKQRKDFILTTETFHLIEQNRKDTEDVTLSLNEYLDVFIVSKQAAGKSSFQAFTSTYIIK